LGSDKAICKEAKGLLRHFRYANAPPDYAAPGILPSSSRATISTTPDGRVDFNFASFGVRSMMLVETMTAEALQDEARELDEIGRLSSTTKVVCARLEREVARFIDGMRGTAPLNVDELMRFTLESVSPYASFFKKQVPREPY
jgi:hypothetical protein